MNIHVDNRIAFEYPPEYLLHRDSSDDSPGFTLEKGNQTIGLLCIQREVWEHLKLTMEFCMKTSAHESEHPDGPQQELWTREISGAAFEGIEYWSKLSSPKGKLILLGLSALVRHGARFVYLRIQDKVIFDEDLAVRFLERISFFGEARYEELKQLGSRHDDSTAGFAIDLPVLGGFGPVGMERSSTFNYSFEGPQLTDAQRQAIQDFAANEITLSEQIKESAYKYYTDEEYPELRDFLDSEQLPQVSNPDEMVRLISVAGICVRQAKADGCVPIVLTFGAEWTENGIRMRIIGNKVEATCSDRATMDED